MSSSEKPAEAATAEKPAEPPVAGAEFSVDHDDHGTSAEFEGTPEGQNQALDRDDQGVAVEIKSRFPHEVVDDGVVIFPDEEASLTKGGIFLPDLAKKRLQSGRVLALGPGKMHENGFLQKPSYKVGQRVLFGKYAGEQIELTYQGRKVLLMRQHNVRLVFGAEG